MPHLKNGQWRIQSWIAGKRVSQYLPAGTPKKVADEIEYKLKMGQIDSSYVKNEIPTFGGFADHFLKVSEGERSVSHQMKLRTILKTCLKPRFASWRIDTIETTHLVDLQRSMLGQGYKVQTISNVLACASVIFREAVFCKHILSNPVHGVRRLKREKRDFQVWSFEEKDRYLMTAREVNFPAFQVSVMALFTGMRPMELRGLLRDSVDFESGQVRIRRQWCTKQNKLVDYTKTRENRTVTVPLDILTVFADKRGLPMDRQLFPEITNNYGVKVLQPLMRQAGVQVIRMHDLRHTFASHLLLRGRNILEVKDVLGHRKLDSTLVYLHFSSDRNKDTTKCLTDGMSFLRGEGKVIQIARH